MIPIVSGTESDTETDTDQYGHFCTLLCNPFFSDTDTATDMFSVDKPLWNEVYIKS